MSTREARVKYVRGAPRADTRKLDAALKAGSLSHADLLADVTALLTLLRSGTAGEFLEGTTPGSDPAYAAATGDLQSNYWQSNAQVAITSTGIPLDDTPPQITEGTEIWSESVTPISATSIIEIVVDLIGLQSVANGTPIIALFTSGSTDSISSRVIFVTSGIREVFYFSHRIASWGTTARTLSARMGVTAGTFTLNIAASQDFGGTVFSSIRWREYIP